MIENLVSNLSFYLESSVALAFFAAYLGGILISFTPCTYPLIPVTVGFIGIQGSSSRGRGFLLSLFYVVGMAATYAVLGAAAALSGRIFGQMQTNFWTYFIMANVCLVMGLSMLDVFNISIPVPQKLMKLTGGNGKKGFLNSFLIGAVSGYVAVKTNVLLGMGLLFVFAFGMGTLLIIAGTFAGVIAALPRSGAWMTKIKCISGMLLIGAAEYFLYIAGRLSI